MNCYECDSLLSVLVSPAASSTGRAWPPSLLACPERRRRVAVRLAHTAAFVLLVGGLILLTKMPWSTHEPDDHAVGGGGRGRWRRHDDPGP